MSIKDHNTCSLFDDDDEEKNIADDVADRAAKFRISMVALSALLHILRLLRLYLMSPKICFTMKNF